MGGGLPWYETLMQCAVAVFFHEQGHGQVLVIPDWPCEVSIANHLMIL